MADQMNLAAVQKHRFLPTVLFQKTHFVPNVHRDQQQPLATSGNGPRTYSWKQFMFSITTHKGYYVDYCIFQLLQKSISCHREVNVFRA